MPGTTLYTTPGLFDSHTGGDPFGFAEVENLLYTRLTADVTAAATTIPVATVNMFPARGILVIGREVITYTGTSGGVQFTGCTRGVDGTTAAVHAAGATVGQTLVAAHVNDLAVAIVALQLAVPRKFAEVTLGAAAATIDFTNIPQTYRHLMLVLTSLNDTAGGANVFARLSSDGTTFDAGNNYDWELLSANNATVTGFGAVAQSSMLIGAHGSAATVMNQIVATFANYANTSYHKTMTASHQRKDGTAVTDLFSGTDAGWWRNTAAIKGIRLFPGTNNFAIGTRATLYGLPA